MKKSRHRLHCLLVTAILLVTPIGLHAAPPSANSPSLVAGFRNPPKEARPSTYWLWLNGYVNRDHVESELKAFHDAGISGVCIFDMGARGAKEAMPPAGPAFMSKPSVGHIAHAVRVAESLGMDVQLSVASSWDMGGEWVEPRHGSMGLFTSELPISGPAEFDDVLPFPSVSSKTPRRADGLPICCRNTAVLAIPADKRRPGHDFVFRLDPAGIHTLDRAALYNTHSDNPTKYGDLHLFTKDFSIAVSTTNPTDEAFREVFTAALKPTIQPQRFDLPAAKARYVRLRLMNGHNTRFDRIQLGEFELFDKEGLNLVVSHVADRSRDGADLIGHVSALGHDRVWTAGNINDGAKSGPGGSWSSAGPPPVVIEDPNSMIELTDRLQEDGRLQWKVPAGRWIIQRFVCTNTGETLKVPSPNSNGLATDHFSSEATHVFLNELIKRLENELGDLGKSALKQLYLASYEVRGAVWTPKMLEQFRRYRGYDMTPYLPALSGNVVVDNETTQRFLYDYRKTLGDLLVDAYYRAAVDAAHAAGLGIESEAGGPGPPIHQVPVDSLKAQGAIDEIRGEYWPKRPDAHGMWVVKETACAGHIYGKRRIHMEAFTSMHHWQDGPFDLKPSADRAFCEGMNHVVWHTASHLPPEAGKPGWVYYAGTHLNTNVVWWPKAKPFLDYLARCSFLLQQGLFVGDVCYYYGDQGYNFVPPKHIDPSLGFGYDYDVTNREVILNRMSVHNGRIVLPDGMSYAVLVLPEREDMDLEVLRKLEQFVREGATVVGPKPTRSNGLTNYPDCDESVRQIADRLWGPCDGRAVFEHTHGRGRIIWGRALQDVLQQKGISPDFAFESPREDTKIDFIHRRTEKADIYFVSNKQSRWERIDVEFRVQGRLPELWDPETGEVTPQYVCHATDNGVAIPLQLAPHGSMFVVFRQMPKKRPSLSLDAPAGSIGVEAARVDTWDGRRARLTVFAPGRYQITTEDGRSAESVVKSIAQPVALDGSWDVEFVDGPGAPSPTRFDELISWTEHAGHRVRHFSGMAQYQCPFQMPEDWLTDERRVLLDLGDLWAVGEVFLNGQSLGVLWKPPFVIDVTKSAVAGRNKLVVEVANTWSNRLVGDASVPEGERLTRTNVMHGAGKRWEETPLLRSGLFGPVRLVPAQVVIAAPD